MGQAALLGRYVLLSKLGAGAMGVVFAAYDPELDRKIALKLIKPRAGYQYAARVRLQREAQALAKLDHPNVVRVFDAGVQEGHLFVAMEFVAGRTLGAWMAEDPPSWRETLELFEGAGQGLAAAHSANLVHRDFKPDNVMIGEDGRVRVMDFGLARRDDAEEPLGDESEGAVASNQALMLSLTRSGTLLGTPAYMSPEQLEGQPADARSDQFGYCVALYEGLYGKRPFVASDLGSLLRVVRDGHIDPPPKGGRVPRWVHGVVTRGLAAKPEERWPSMQALLDALADDPALRRRKWGLGGAAVGLLAAAVGVGSMVGPAVTASVAATAAAAPEGESCDSFVSQLDERWNPTISDALRQRIASVEPDEANYVVAELGRLASSWRSTASALCEGVYAPSANKRARQCLEAWLTSFDRIAETLAKADAEQLGGAPNLLARLMPEGEDYCAIQPDRGVSPEITKLAQSAREMAELGDYEHAKSMAVLALELANASGDQDRYTREQAEAHAAFGEVLAFTSATRQADEALARAQEHARATQYYRLELDVVLMRIKNAAEAGAREVAGTLLEQVAPLSELLELGADDPRRAESHEARGLLECERGDYEEGIKAHGQSRRIFERTGRPLAAAKATLNIGKCWQKAADHEQAKSSYEQAWRMYEDVGVTPRYRNLVTTRLNLAKLGYDSDDPEALTHLDAVIEHGSTNQRLEATALGILLEDEGEDHERALQRVERGLALLDMTPNPPPTPTSNIRLAAGMVLSADDRSRAETQFLEAERIVGELEPEYRLKVCEVVIRFLAEEQRCDEAEDRLRRLESELDAESSVGLDLTELARTISSCRAGSNEVIDHKTKGE